MDPVPDFRVTALLREVNPSVCEYRGTLGDGTKVFVRECRSQHLETASSDLISEASRLSQMTSDLVVARISHKLSGDGSTFYFQLVLEWMNRNLETEIRRRTAPWTEPESRQFLRDFTNLLAKGQSLGFAHRNLNPQSFFLSPDGRLKLGNFASSMSQHCGAQFPMHARVSHMAPEVRKIYFQYLTTEVANFPQYDVFRADVYSLGLTMLEMVTLKSFGENPEKELDNLPIQPELCGFFKIMLEKDPALRPDFFELRQTLCEIWPTFYRPSSRSTDVSDRSLSTRLSDIRLKGLSFAEAWAADANDITLAAKSLKKLWAFRRNVDAGVSIEMVCNKCRVIYTVHMAGNYLYSDLLLCSRCR